MNNVAPRNKDRGENSCLFIKVKVAIPMPKKNTGFQGFSESKYDYPKVHSFSEVKSKAHSKFGLDPLNRISIATKAR
ncbi:MAG TPA: hypothetical protein DDY75_03210 [Sphingobacterium sp.]|jgi:hypothetical protein|nr:hypothetical protein [Sphingobacterium sp.]HBI86892.1 hypothetical protein [Sphingobacterium sp.]